jgi:inner membrane protein YidH
MDTPVKGDPVADLRDYLAEERTLPAWVRTGIALMGLGILVAHFGIVGNESQTAQQGAGAHVLSLWFATALIAIGVIVNLFAAQRYTRLVGELNRGRLVHRSLSRQGVIVALFLALLGIALTIYMIPVLA